MSDTFKLIHDLVAAGDFYISEHGYDELAADGLFVDDILAGLPKAIVLEDYPNFHKGPCVLVLQHDKKGQPVHVVWGLPSGPMRPAVLVTAYRPDPAKWTQDFRRRRT